MARSKRSTDHITIMDGGAFRCLHCGATFNPHGDDGRPVEMWAMASIAKGFADQHSRCRPPSSPRCAFCHSPDHGTGEHVNATTKRPEDWLTSGDTGTSSRAIWKQMTGRVPGTRPSAGYPLDPSDFGRCYRLLAAPWAQALGWRARIGEMAAHGAVWARLAAAWDELEALYREELPTGVGTKLYAMMQALRADEGDD